MTSWIRLLRAGCSSSTDVCGCARAPPPFDHEILGDLQRGIRAEILLEHRERHVDGRAHPAELQILPSRTKMQSFSTLTAGKLPELVDVRPVRRGAAPVEQAGVGQQKCAEADRGHPLDFAGEIEQQLAHAVGQRRLRQRRPDEYGVQLRRVSRPGRRTCRTTPPPGRHPPR
jgi:hypothetical protein